MWCGEAYGWIDADPTNNLLPSDRHITIGWGRDFSDIRHLHERLRWQSAEFWQLWQRRFPGRSVADAQAKARLKLEALMLSRPLEKVQPPIARTALAAARAWLLNDLLTHDSGH